MIESFMEDILGLMSIVWLMAITGMLIITMPIWFIPYTTYRLYKWVKEKNT